MNKIQLSICIPTYNRKEKVIQQIERIIFSGILNSSNEVELVVSDNCSDDKTYESLVSLYGRQKGILLYHQDKNLGLVGNLYYLFNTANGNYIWFLSDDDPIDPNSINKLLSLITDDPRSFYLLNFTTDQDSQLYWKECDDYLSLFKDKTWGGWGLLSIQVLNKTDFTQFYKDSLTSYNLCQPVAVSLYGLLYQNGKVCYDIKALTHHVGNYSWQDKVLEVNSIYLFYSIHLLKSYGDSIKYQLIKEKLIEIKSFCVCSFFYLIKRNDWRYIKDLSNEGIFVRVIIRGACQYVKKKFLIIRKYDNKNSSFFK